MKYDEVSPPGWTGTVKAMKIKHGKEIDNPWALAWYMKNKGDKAHYKNVKSSKGTRVPPKKEKYKKEDKKKDESFSFRNWLEQKEQ